MVKLVLEDLRMAKEIKLEVKIDLDMNECWVCEFGTYKACSYSIESIKEVGDCVNDYIDTYVEPEKE